VDQMQKFTHTVI